MTYEQIESLLAAEYLRPMGVVRNTILLIGPLEPGFWPHFTQSAEWHDGMDDPIDRWSARVISKLAEVTSSTPHFPFGEPTAPFLTWAVESDAAWQSPVGMLVHADAGLMISYRGALEFLSPLPSNVVTRPCDACQAPCKSACPIGALTDQGYDIPACQAFLKTDDGADCLNNGCLVRRACPVSQTYARAPEQSGYHMRRFLK